MSADRETAIATIRSALTRAASPLEFEEGRQAWVDDALAELDSLLDALAQLRAERDTLREALREIGRYIEDEYSEGDKPFQVAIVARAALASVPDEATT